MKQINALFFILILTFSYQAKAEYTEQQRIDALDVLKKIKVLDGLDKELVLPQYELELSRETDAQKRLEIIYKIVTLANTGNKANSNYILLKELAKKLKLTEYEQIAELHLIHTDLKMYSEKNKASLAVWRKKMPSSLSDRLKAHYLWRLSRADKSQTTIQQMVLHYQKLKSHNKLPQEQFYLLKRILELDEVSTQNFTLAKQLFSLTYTERYPYNRFIYLYNQVQLFIDHFEVKLAKTYADFYLELASKLNNREELFFSHQALGLIAILNEDYPKAIEISQTAMTYVDDLPERWLAQSKRFEARAFLLLGKLEKAKPLHQFNETYLKKTIPTNRVNHFHSLNSAYITLLEGRTLQGIKAVEKIVNRNKTQNIAEKNKSISTIRDLAIKEQTAKLEAKKNLNRLTIAIAILSLFFISIFILLVYQIKTRKALQKSRDHILKISRTDGLTQLHNRQYWQMCLQDEINRLKRYNKSDSSLIIFDIDHFKSINDTYGHNGGDAVLNTVANIIKSHIRDTDIAGRFGGEEFVILLPETHVQKALPFTERLRVALESSSTAYKEHVIKFTSSFGISGYEPKFESTTQWLEQADKALYQAKETGRNKTVISN